MRHRAVFSTHGGRWWLALLFGGAVIFGGFHWGTKATAVSDLGAPDQTNCDAWDRAASEGIAAIVSDRSIAAELRLDEAILQLRRARKNCRAGSIALAGHDYASLHRTFPNSTASIRPNPRDGSNEAAPR